MTFARAIAALVLAGCTGHTPSGPLPEAGVLQIEEVEPRLRPPSLVGPGVEGPSWALSEPVEARLSLMDGVAVSAAIGREVQVRATDLPLAGLVGALATGHLSHLGELELVLNAPALALHRVDIDADGALDRLELRERRDVDSMYFYILAVPASAPAVSLPIAMIEVTVNRSIGLVVVSGAFTSYVEGGDEVREMVTVPADFSGGKMKVLNPIGGLFVLWALNRGRPAHARGGEVSRDADGGVRLGAAYLSPARLGELQRTIAAADHAGAWQRATQAGQFAEAVRRTAGGRRVAHSR